MTQAENDRRATLFGRIRREAEALNAGERRPSLNDRYAWRRRATGAIMSAAEKIVAEGRRPTEEELIAAGEAEFHGTTFNAVGAGWITLLLPIIVNIILWWIDRNYPELATATPAPAL